MGSSTAPKMFSNSASTLGLSGGDAVTQAQPVAQVANPGAPSFSAYSQQQAAPAAATNPDMPDAGSAQDMLSQFRNRQGRVPFYGAYS